MRLPDLGLDSGPFTFRARFEALKMRGMAVIDTVDTKDTVLYCAYITTAPRVWSSTLHCYPRGNSINAKDTYILSPMVLVLCSCHQVIRESYCKHMIEARL